MLESILSKFKYVKWLKELLKDQEEIIRSQEITISSLSVVNRDLLHLNDDVLGQNKELFNMSKEMIRDLSLYSTIISSMVNDATFIYADNKKERFIIMDGKKLDKYEDYQVLIKELPPTRNIEVRARKAGDKNKTTM